MGGGGKGGSADQSGMFQAMAAADAANKAYDLGLKQFQWSKDVWTQEQPLIDASTMQQMALAAAQTASMTQMTNEAGQQWDTYIRDYLPEEEKLIGQVNDWASPGNQALVRGQAMGDIGEQGQASLNAAAETLRGYGINPSSPRYASLYTSEQPMIGAAEAAAGTTASQNLKLQQLGLESGVVNTGRGMVNTTGALTTAGTGAGNAGANAASGAGQTAFGNLAGTAVGAGATSNLFNAGTGAMNSYVNAVNGYNQSQAEFAQANATEMAGLGSAVGGLTGLAFLKSDERSKTDIKREGTHPSGVPLYSYRYKEDPKSYPKVVGPMAQDIARIAPEAVREIPGSGGTKMITAAYDDGGGVGVGVGDVAAPPDLLTNYRDPPPIPASSPGLIATHGQPAGGLALPSGQIQQVRIHPDAPRQPPVTPAEQAKYIGNNGGAPLTIRNRGEGRGAPLMREAGGPIDHYAYGGDVALGIGNPLRTPQQGGGVTGIPAQPMPSGGGTMPIPHGGTPGGTVPVYASASGGQVPDDVDAKLTAGEFVIPKDVAMWKGHEYFARELDKARKGQQQFSQRDDVGGEPAPGIPQAPTFVSRPALPGMG